MLTVQDKAIQTLTGLGLTVLQAKVYLAFPREGKSTVKGLAKTSKVARQDIYRISTQLLNLGLIEKLVDTPTKFKAIPIKAAVDMLIERRKKETAQLEQKSTEVVRSLIAANEQAELTDDESQFIIMKDLQARLIKAREKIQSVKKSVKIVTSWSFFLTYVLENVEEYIEAVKRGVNVQVVVEKPKKIGKLPKKLKTLMKHPLFQIRYVSSLPPSIVAIFDNEEVRIPIQTNTAPWGTGVLVSNNPSLIELAENYFEVVWDGYKLCPLLLNAIPYPAMLIQTDRTVIAANKVALEMGAKIGEPCWREFGKCMFLRDRKERCWFCMADEAMSENAQKHRDVEALGHVWNTWWIPVEKEIFLHFAIDCCHACGCTTDVTKCKQVNRGLSDTPQV